MPRITERRARESSVTVIFQNADKTRFRPRIAQDRIAALAVFRHRPKSEPSPIFEPYKVSPVVDPRTSLRPVRRAYTRSTIRPSRGSFACLTLLERQTQ